MESVLAAGVPGPALAFFDPLLVRDGAGGSWLGPLLRAAPRGPQRFGALADAPGWLEIPLAVATADGRRGAFTYPAAPSRELLGWLIDHPDALTWADEPTSTPEARRLRRALVDDEPSGVRARAQDRAHDLLRRGNPVGPTWWRFEETTTLDAALVTDRLVLVVQGRRDRPGRSSTPWFPPRSALVRDLEAARRLAAGRPWGVLLLTDACVPDGTVAAVKAAIAAGAPQLDGAGRADLLGGYLGNLTWAQAATATGLEPAAALGAEPGDRSPAHQTSSA